LGQPKRGIFFENGLDSKIVDKPVGQITSFHPLGATRTISGNGGSASHRAACHPRLRRFRSNEKKKFVCRKNTELHRTICPTVILLSPPNRQTKSFESWIRFM
jgi:hypothetical protein